MYIQVQFKKGNEPTQDKARIKITDAFFSMYKNKAGFSFPKLVIMSYVEEQETQQQNDLPPFMDEDSLPF